MNQFTVRTRQTTQASSMETSFEGEDTQIWTPWALQVAGKEEYEIQATWDMVQLALFSRMSLYSGEAKSAGPFRRLF